MTCDSFFKFALEFALISLCLQEKAILARLLCLLLANVKFCGACLALCCLEVLLLLGALLLLFGCFLNDLGAVSLVELLLSLIDSRIAALSATNFDLVDLLVASVASLFLELRLLAAALGLCIAFDDCFIGAAGLSQISQLLCEGSAALVL